MGDQINKNRLFYASCIALIVTSMTFAIRARLETVFGSDFGLTSEELGFAFGPAFWGFTLAMVIGGPLVDIFGMKRIMWLAFLGHAAGILLTILATDFITLFIGTLLTGLGNGMVEAACNPLVATMYPKEKPRCSTDSTYGFPEELLLAVW